MQQHAFDEHYQDYPVALIDGEYYRYGCHPLEGYLVENVEHGHPWWRFGTRQEMQAFLDAQGAKRLSDSAELGAPWSLHFDRDGTEDFGIISDAEGNRIVASHICGKDEYEGTFWLPEEGDPVPRLVRQMRVMAAAPKLLEAAKRTLRQFELILEMNDPQACTQMEWEAEPLSSLREAIIEAEGDKP